MMYNIKLGWGYTLTHTHLFCADMSFIAGEAKANISWQMENHGPSLRFRVKISPQTKRCLWWHHKYLPKSFSSSSQSNLCLFSEAPAGDGDAEPEICWGWTEMEPELALVGGDEQDCHERLHRGGCGCGGDQQSSAEACFSRTDRPEDSPWGYSASAHSRALGAQLSPGRYERNNASVPWRWRSGSSTIPAPTTSWNTGQWGENPGMHVGGQGDCQLWLQRRSAAATVTRPPS